MEHPVIPHLHQQAALFQGDASGSPPEAINDVQVTHTFSIPESICMYWGIRAIVQEDSQGPTHDDKDAARLKDI